MPVHRAKNPRSKKEVNKAASKNIQEMMHNPKGRSRKQIIAIGISEAKSKKKR